MVPWLVMVGETCVIAVVGFCCPEEIVTVTVGVMVVIPSVTTAHRLRSWLVGTLEEVDTSVGPVEVVVVPTSERVGHEEIRSPELEGFSNSDNDR